MRVNLPDKVLAVILDSLQFAGFEEPAFRYSEQEKIADSVKLQVAVALQWSGLNIEGCFLQTDSTNIGSIPTPLRIVIWGGNDFLIVDIQSRKNDLKTSHKCNFLARSHVLQFTIESSEWLLFDRPYSDKSTFAVTIQTQKSEIKLDAFNQNTEPLLSFVKWLTRSSTATG